MELKQPKQGVDCKVFLARFNLLYGVGGYAANVGHFVKLLVWPALIDGVGELMLTQFRQVLANEMLEFM